MSTPRSTFLCAFLGLTFSAAGCGDDDGMTFDASVTDGGTMDAAATDGAVEDGGSVDGGIPTDAPLVDAGTSAPPQFPPPDLGDWTGTEAPVLGEGSPPMGALADLDATQYAALPCGPHTENLFDVLEPNDDSTGRAMVLFIHGGGFTAGSRMASFTGRAAETRAYVEAGFVYATIDYRFLDDAGLRTPLQDAQVCVQYIRLHAETFGVDPNRIVLAGSSAGAGTSLWLGTSDELALDDGPAVLQVSTRFPGVIIDRTQASYDVIAWANTVFAPEYTETLNGALMLGAFDGRLDEFFGLDGAPRMNLFTDPDLVRFRETVDMLALIDADDAEIWAETEDADLPPTDAGIVVHHPFHVRAILREARDEGLPAQANASAIGETASETRVAFAQRVVAP